MHTDGTVELVHTTAREYVSALQVKKDKLTRCRYLIRTKFINLRDVDYSMSLLCIEYLSLPQVLKDRSEIDIEVDLVDGIHPFYDYASACWAMHLQSGVADLQPGEKLTRLQETLETFIENHWSPTHRRLPDLKRIQTTLSSLQSSELFDKIVQAVGWSRKQTGKHGQGPTEDEALDFWQVTSKIRSVLERMHADGHNTPTMQQLYGQNWFKCPRVNCYSYHRGFSTLAQRDAHTNKHDRPFLCIVSACPWQSFGFAAEDDLKTHLFEFHGIDLFTPSDMSEFPDPPKSNPHANTTAKSPATFACHLCPKTFTRKHNLKAHLRTHDGTKPFSCTTCGERFTRKQDCDRHQRGHGDKPFICVGPLEPDPGSNNPGEHKTWGCRTGFSRADKLADHIRSKAGQKCLRPLVLERLRKGLGDVGDDELVGNLFGDIGHMQAGPVETTAAAALMPLSKTLVTLPSFREFLALCRVDCGKEGGGACGELETTGAAGNGRSGGVGAGEGLEKEEGEKEEVL